MEGHTSIEGIYFLGYCVFREKVVFLTSKDMHFMPMCQRQSQSLGVHF